MHRKGVTVFLVIFLAQAPAAQLFAQDNPSGTGWPRPLTVSMVDGPKILGSLARPSTSSAVHKGQQLLLFQLICRFTKSCQRVQLTNMTVSASV